MFADEQDVEVYLAHWQGYEVNPAIAEIILSAESSEMQQAAYRIGNVCTMTRAEVLALPGIGYDSRAILETILRLRGLQLKP